LARLALLFALAAGLTAAEWTEVSSPNFQLYTTSGEAEGRRTIEYFEQVRDFFMRVRSRTLTTKLPVTVILFRNEKEFRPYAPYDGIAAFFTGDQSRDFIVMSGAAEDDRPVAVHEYMHLLIRHMELKIPVWLNEGIAEVYSTLRPLGGKIMVGAAPKNIGYTLGADKWLPLERLCAIGHDSPEFNEKNRRGILYAQSWMLTHMLMLDERYSAKFGALLAAVSSGMRSEDAFSKIYGKTFDQVTKDLRAYFSANSLKGVLFDARLEKAAALMPKRAAEFDVELTLARLAGITGKREEAEVRLERLAASHPDRWEPWEALGQVAWRKNDRTAAAKYLKRAVDMNPPSWTVYWDYVRLAGASGSAAIIPILQRLLQLNGSLTDARMMLGYELYSAERYQEALQVYKTIRSVDAERAPRLFLGMAHSAARAGEWSDAEAAAAQAVKYAQKPEDVSSARQLADYLEGRKRAQKQ
jgi:tetratricopeptide (TPR) repeat protein